MPGWPLISTPRLCLRPARLGDLPAIEAALADPRFPSELPLARMLRELKLSSWLRRMTSDPLNTRLWAATPLGTDSCIGTVALIEEKSPETWWLSYWLSPVEWNKGLASEAVGSLLGAAAQRAPLCACRCRRCAWQSAQHSLAAETWFHRSLNHRPRTCCPRRSRHHAAVAASAKCPPGVSLSARMYGHRS